MVFLILENALYLLVLLNPASKVLFLSSYEPKLNEKQNFELAWKSSTAAFVILTLISGAGHYLLSRVFRVELYSLQVTGGLVVFLMGLTAIREGKFVRKNESSASGSLTELSLVPLAAPLIAGPGMIAASITISMRDGFSFCIPALTLALSINFILMIFSSAISRTLGKLHFLGPLIRLTGLVIAAVAVQMIFSGLHAWIITVR